MHLTGMFIQEIPFKHKKNIFHCGSDPILEHCQRCCRVFDFIDWTHQPAVADPLVNRGWTRWTAEVLTILSTLILYWFSLDHHMFVKFLIFQAVHWFGIKYIEIKNYQDIFMETRALKELNNRLTLKNMKETLSDCLFFFL